MPLTHEIPHNSATHAKLIAAIRDRLCYARSMLGGSWDRIRRDEDLFYAYTEAPTDEAGSYEHSRDDKRRPAYRTITIPYSYAIALTDHTYISSIFLSRDPIFQVRGRHAETQNSELAVEACLAYQVHAGGMRPYLMNWLMDPFRTGVGIVACHWAKEYSTVAEIVDTTEGAGLYGKLFGKKKQYIEKEVVSYEGNRVYAVRPTDFIRDPRYSLLEYQRGEFCGETMVLPRHHMEDMSNRGVFIKGNVKEALKLNAAGTTAKGSTRQPEPDRTRIFANSETERFAFEGLDFIWKIVPSEWGLGPSKKLTKYLFTIAEESIIVRATPLGAYHDMFPYAVIPLEIDAYKLTSRSMMQIVEPMETTMSWLLNQHFYNVRKHLNNNGIVDPSKIVMKDLYTRPPGGYIRMRPEAYGQDPSTAYFQMPTTDITRSHLSDMRLLEEFSQRLTGTNDNVMGLVNPGGRKTASEVRTSSSFATNRLKVQGEWFSTTGFKDLMRMMVSNSQQYITEERKLRIAGNLVKPGQVPYATVNPETIAGFYDFEPVDGNMPIDRISVANILRDLVMQAAQIPQLQQSFDFPSAISHIANLMGVRNFDSFKIQVVPDQQALQQAQAGNVVPLRPAAPIDASGNLAIPQ